MSKRVVSELVTANAANEATPIHPFLYPFHSILRGDTSLAQLTGAEKTAYVRAMFGRITHRYDLLNTVISGGMHHRWRVKAARTALEVAPTPNAKALDVATGTGDFAISLLQQGAPHVVGLDFVPGMLTLAGIKARRRKLRGKLTLLAGDAQGLPLPSDTFQWVTSGFNMRNVADLPLALSEMVRVTQPGGRVVILEITPIEKKGLFPALFRWYFRRVTPLLGRVLTGDHEAYTYLPESVAQFQNAPALARMLEAAGLDHVRYQLVGFGAAAIHVGDKPRQ
ncbi:MAG: ubiquinone/menaquinone biosynthesis methyltransferase [Dehalococcoidia bacterium]|nr:ubiquinone/menaquinone biosynthesis methyltransferase [Dehalococcoidia bacterium]